MTEPISFEERRNRLLADRAAKSNAFSPPPSSTPPQPKQQEYPSEFVPDIGPSNRSDVDIEIDKILDNLDIIEAYNKFCGKMTPEPGGKREGVMISCPKPSHRDKNPSAWLNLDKDTWFCATCEEGGDSYDIAAYNLGYPVPDYKNGSTFHSLRQDMAERFGLHVKNVAGGKIAWRDDESETQANKDENDGQQEAGDSARKVSEPAEPSPQEGGQPSAGVPEQGESDDSSADGDGASISHLYADEEDEEPELVIYPSIDWRSFVTPNTFLYEYLESTTIDDSPEEYHFWHGLIALGHAVGRNVTLDDHRPVYSNMLLCLLGATGTGKTRSRGWLNTVVREAMPFKADGTTTSGVKLVPVPSSGEYLVQAFSYEGKDPAGNRSIGPQPVNGIVDFDELAGLLSRANRQGSTLKPTIMGFADAADEVKIGGVISGDRIAYSPFCSITASTQPKAVRSLLNKTDTGSGFLNRWVFAGGVSKQREVIGGSHSSTRVDLAKPTEELKKVHGWGSVQRSITLDADALEMLTRFYRDTVFPMQIKDQSDLLKRLDLLFKKIILLFAINERKSVADAPVVGQAIKLFSYVVDCYAILDANIGVTQSQEIAQDILKHIERHQAKTGRGASARDIARYTHRKKYSPDQIKKALDAMIALDWVELDKKNQGAGRPTTRWKAVGND